MEPDFYTTLLWRAARAAALARDDYRCQAVEGYDCVEDEFGDWIDVEIECGETNGLHVHHIVRPENGGGEYALDNLTTLCTHHHAKMHKMMRDRARLESAEAAAESITYLLPLAA
jgi:5-methylcytosine-specific restriction endonuclease McrA